MNVFYLCDSRSVIVNSCIHLSKKRPADWPSMVMGVTEGIYWRWKTLLSVSGTDWQADGLNGIEKEKMESLILFLPSSSSLCLRFWHLPPGFQHRLFCFPIQIHVGHYSEIQAFTFWLAPSALQCADSPFIVIHTWYILYNICFCSEYRWIHHFRYAGNDGSCEEAALETQSLRESLG